MKTQINHKQITVLVLAVMLAVASYWIPLPSGAQAPKPGFSNAVIQFAKGGSLAHEAISAQP